MAEAAAILLFGALGWFWLDSMRAREAARLAGVLACRRHGLQFLDDTVAVSALGLARDRRGHAKIRRTYRFEFSDTGDNRLEGAIVVLGAEVESVVLEPRSERRDIS
jgi:hypothetical protein